MAASASAAALYTLAIYTSSAIYTPCHQPPPLVLSLMRCSGQRQCTGQRYVPPPPAAGAVAASLAPSPSSSYSSHHQLPGQSININSIPPPSFSSSSYHPPCLPPSLTLMSRIGIAFVSPRSSSWRTLGSGTTRRAIFIILVSFALNLFLFFCFLSPALSLRVCACVCLCVLSARSTGLTPPFRAQLCLVALSSLLILYAGCFFFLTFLVIFELFCSHTHTYKEREREWQVSLWFCIGFV